MSAFMPIGLCVSARMRRSPSRKPSPWTNVNVTGWAMPIPPASETAATSSTLLHGYMAPPMSGTSTRAWRVSGVSSVTPAAWRGGSGGGFRRSRPRHEPEPPQHTHGGHEVARLVADLRAHLEVGVAGDLGERHPAFRHQRPARLLRELDRDRAHDPSHVPRHPCGHGQTARELAQVGERDRVHGAQVVPHRMVIPHPDLRVARRKGEHGRPDAGAVGHGAPEDQPEHLLAERHPLAAAPPAQEPRAGRWASRRQSPSSPAIPSMASRTNAMCWSRSTPSSAAPFRMSSRLTFRAKPALFIFFFTESTATEASFRSGVTSAHATRNPDSSSHANSARAMSVSRGTPE